MTMRPRVRRALCRNIVGNPCIVVCANCRTRKIRHNFELVTVFRCSECGHDKAETYHAQRGLDFFPYDRNESVIRGQERKKRKGPMFPGKYRFRLKNPLGGMNTFD